MIVVPPSFRAMPRWWHDDAGRAWLDALPAIVEAACTRWQLAVDGPVLHGSNALVVPVHRGAEAAVLRVAPPGDDVDVAAEALAHWDGHGVVRLLELDRDARTFLLERLDDSHSLASEPVLDAIATLGSLTRTLAIPAPKSVASTRDIAAAAVESFPREWRDLGEPTTPGVLDATLAAARRLAAADPGSRSVNGDLHFGQVLAGGRHEWTVVDPVLLRGDPEYDVGRVLWSRLDELPTDAAVHRAVELFVHAASVPLTRARDWVLVRSMSYLLWGLRRGLTEDPPRCLRLLDLFA